MIHLQIDSWARAKPGERRCGDGVATRLTGDYAIVGLADGLGHGPEAAEAADAFVEVLHTSEGTDPLGLIEEADRALRGTRGAAAMVLVVHCPTAAMRGAGVGNVGLRSVRDAVGGVAAPGILGRRPRRIRPFECTLVGGDRLVLFSDGLSSRFDLEELGQYGARGLVERHGRLHDDASCLKLVVHPGRELAPAR